MLRRSTARELKFQITTWLSSEMPIRSAAAGDISNSVPPSVASSTTAAIVNGVSAPDEAISVMVSPAAAPRRSAVSLPITTVVGVSRPEMVRPMARADELQWEHRRAHRIGEAGRRDLDPAPPRVT